MEAICISQPHFPKYFDCEQKKSSLSVILELVFLIYFHTPVFSFYVTIYVGGIDHGLSVYHKSRTQQLRLTSKYPLKMMFLDRYPQKTSLSTFGSIPYNKIAPQADHYKLIGNDLKANNERIAGLAAKLMGPDE